VVPTVQESELAAAKGSSWYQIGEWVSGATEVVAPLTARLSEGMWATTDAMSSATAATVNVVGEFGEQAQDGAYVAYCYASESLAPTLSSAGESVGAAYNATKPRAVEVFEGASSAAGSAYATAAPFVESVLP
jgi:hypothetical protein